MGKVLVPVCAAGSVTEVRVAGRGGVPNGSTAAVLNVTVTGPGGAGYVTVYPCGSDRPTSSNLNYIVGQTVPNAVITKIGTNGNVCFYTQSATHLIIDINRYFPAGSAYSALVPARLFDTRTDPGTSTIDGQGLGAGLLAAGSVTQSIDGLGEARSFQDDAAILQRHRTLQVRVVGVDVWPA